MVLMKCNRKTITCGKSTYPTIFTDKIKRLHKRHKQMGRNPHLLLPMNVWIQQQPIHWMVWSICVNETARTEDRFFMTFKCHCC